MMENKKFATQNLVGEKTQFAAAATDMKITKPPPPAIINNVLTELVCNCIPS